MERKGNTYLLRDNVFLMLICPNLVISANEGAGISHSAVSEKTGPSARILIWELRRIEPATAADQAAPEPLVWGSGWRAGRAKRRSERLGVTGALPQ